MYPPIPPLSTPPQPPRPGQSQSHPPRAPLRKHKPTPNVTPTPRGSLSDGLNRDVRPLTRPRPTKTAESVASATQQTTPPPPARPPRQRKRPRLYRTWLCCCFTCRLTPCRLLTTLALFLALTLAILGFLLTTVPPEPSPSPTTLTCPPTTPPCPPFAIPSLPLPTASSRATHLLHHLDNLHSLSSTQRIQIPPDLATSLPNRNDLLHVQSILTSLQAEETALQTLLTDLEERWNLTTAQLAQINDLKARLWLPGWLGVVGGMEFRGRECRVLGERERVKRLVGEVSARGGGLGSRLLGLRGLLRVGVEDLCVWEKSERGRRGEDGGEWWWRAPRELRLVVALTRRYCRVVRGVVEDGKGESPVVVALERLEGEVLAWEGGTVECGGWQGWVGWLLE
ncbi:hypothetical protein CONLIGDRAFT_719429 [Coniochaeta ligniaria NRRL 30616]|uniref:Uncharacterized protein n=1 Tax=Coniochaeta ligniaria NRRL 30616 TaxID=1408157 RepID=A0A1J7I6L5_9PEZI|nr:hypothetical protein CONLIGDRAFT_719429 [Coniochaeta ligniaria NRRL 30616]